MLCYNLMEGVIDKEKEILLVTELDLFTLGTITLLEPKIPSVAIFGAKVDIEDLMFNFQHFKGQILVETMFICIKVEDLDIAH